MTTPDVRCTCSGTCHPERAIVDYVAQSRSPIFRAASAPRWITHGRDVHPVPFDTGTVHGPDMVTVAGPHAWRRMHGDNVSARIMAATDHIGRGTRNA